MLNKTDKEVLERSNQDLIDMCEDFAKQSERITLTCMQSQITIIELQATNFEQSEQIEALLAKIQRLEDFNIELMRDRE